MKKIALFLVILVGIGLISCNKDPEHLIARKWKMKEMTFEGKAGGGLGGVLALSGEVVNLKQAKATLQFFKDGTVKGDSKDSLRLEIGILGQTITQIIAPIANDGNTVWELKGDKLLFSDKDGEVSEFFVEKLTRNSLILVMNEFADADDDFDDDDDEDFDMDAGMVGEFRLVLKR